MRVISKIALHSRDSGGRSGLAAFSEKTLLQEALQFSIGECVRSQDSVHFISSIARNRAGRDISWQFFKDNFDLLKGR